MNEKRYVIVSKILGPFGLRGEAKCSFETDILENITKQKVFYARKGSKRITLEVEYIKLRESYVLIKFKGIDTPEAVRFFKGFFLEIPEEELVPLKEGEFYRFQLLGFSVYTLEGTFLGVLEDFMVTGAYDIFVIRNGEKEVLVPSVFVEKIDPKSKVIIIRTIEGLI